MRKFYSKAALFLLTLVFLSTSSGDLFAGGDLFPVGARRTGLANAYTGITGDFWSMFANPAGLAGIERMQAGVFGEQRFLVSGLNYGAFGFAMPVADQHFAGLDLQGFGEPGLYTDSRFGLTYATNVVDRLSLGARISYTNISIGGTTSSPAQNAGTLIINAGLNAKILPGLNLGFSVYNANQGNLDRDLDEKVPTTYSFGLAWEASDKVLLLADIEKHIDYAVAFNGGVEYRINELIAARMGVGTQPTRISGGIGVNWQQFEGDFSASYHEQLGLTPGLSISYKFGKVKEQD